MTRAPALLSTLALAFTGTSAAGNTVGGASYAVQIEQSDLSDRADGGESISWMPLQLTVLSDGPDGKVFVYDLPPDADAKQRAREWQLPATIAYAPDGSARLLEREAHEARLTVWLADNELTREACGQWLTTSYSLFVECDPDAIVAMVDLYKLPSAHLTEGMMVQPTGMLGSAPLRMETSVDGRAILAGQWAIDPEQARADLVTLDMALASFAERPIAEADAKAARADDSISGTVTVQFDLSDAPAQWVRTERITMRVDNGEGKVEATRTERVTTWTRTK